MHLTLNLTGRVALVTGATGQLGRTIARTLADCGAAVAVHYQKNRKLANEIAGAIRQRGGRSVAVSADIADADSVEGMRGEIAARLGDPDILCLSAFQQYPRATVLEQPIEDYESTFATCVRQTVLLSKALVPAMVQRRHGRIIGINTEAALLNEPRQSAYVAGKRGMDGVLRVLAREVGKHQITVNQVAPGWMISDRHRENGTERIEGYDEKVPLQRRGNDQDVANAVAFLSSDLAGFISGAFLPVCGGTVMPAI